MPLARLLGERLLAGGGRSLTTRDALSGASAVGLYFSASWCPPCRGFTPQLIASYAQSLEPKGFKCVLVSSDQDEAAFSEYFAKMPWLALPYEDRQRQQQLSQLFKVQTIPTLAIVDPQGRTITTEARDAVVRDPGGAEYPWAPPLVRDLADGNPGRLNEIPSIVWLCETVGSGTQQQVRDGLLDVAQAREAAAAADSDGKERTYGFFVGSGGELCSRVRELCHLPPVGGASRLLLVDIPDNGGFYLGPEGEDALKKDAVQQLLKDYEAGLLERKQLGPPS
eukprot:gnl/TRDRNA2_/TRDRNA2_28103_c0_seq1.p1 gnl/TRDRNA2_/TRDRNA2_28103_c0~~gnl/TRDRNA2_/TRDRNA2_28103_c0_seq1.p1  ORF type:complete len:281 (+),score=64.38 gnl/TRDRNA2_/TRDRNA2_28103_c0_seq1:65-907(+)